MPSAIEILLALTFLVAAIALFIWGYHLQKTQKIVGIVVIFVSVLSLILSGVVTYNIIEKEKWISAQKKYPHLRHAFEDTTSII